MSRKQKIIVSVTGIFLVLLILVGLTYAYFLTQITGNTNEKSISVTTADLRLTYGDGTTQILTSNTKLVPSSNPIGTKDFTVTNDGDATSYAVIIENVIVKDATTEELTTFNSNDFVYTLSCTSNNGTCNGVTEQTILPMSDNILVENDIDENEVHTYEIVVYYLETNKDQSADMNKTLEARINIEDPNRINPYSSNTNSLAYKIIYNALNVNKDDESKGYAVFRSAPLTKPAESPSYMVVPGEPYEMSTVDSVEFTDNVAWTYGTGYELNSDGTFNLLNPQVCYSDLLYITPSTCNLIERINNGEKIYLVSNKDGENYVPMDGMRETNNLKYVYRIIGSYYDESTSKTYFNVKGTTPTPIIFESTLSVQQDDYTLTSGYNSYYFRGSVENNYLEFNGMCWRVVRIEGDGSVKVTLAAQKKCSEIKESDTTSAFIGQGDYGYINDVDNVDNVYGYTNYYVADYEDTVNRTTSMKYKFDEWFNLNLSNVSNKLKSSSICVGNLKEKYNYREELIGAPEWDYDNFLRLTQMRPSFLCNNDAKTINDYQIYPLTVDEVIFAGGLFDNYSFDYASIYYLNENANLFNSAWLTASVSTHYSSVDTAFYVLDGIVSGYGLPAGDGAVYYDYYLRPAISLISGIELANNSGDGTKTSPYRVVES